MKILLSAVTTAAATAALIVGVSSVALAGQCPKDMKKIDAALASSPNLTAAQLTEITALRSEGAAQHKAGAHGSSVDTLAKAMAILGIN